MPFIFLFFGLGSGQAASSRGEWEWRASQLGACVKIARVHKEGRRLASLTLQDKNRGK